MAKELYEIILRSSPASSTRPELLWPVFQQLYNQPRAEIPACFIAYATTEKAIHASAASRISPRLSAPLPDTLSLFTTLHLLPLPFDVTDVFSLADLHRLSMVNKSCYAWVYRYLLPVAWERLLSSMPEKEWKWENNDTGWNEVDWSYIDVDFTFPPSRRDLHHHHQQKNEELLASEKENVEPKEKEEEGEGEKNGREVMHYPSLWAKTCEWRTDERWPEQKDVTQFVSRKGTDQVSADLKDRMPSWMPSLLCSFASAASWFGRKDIPTSDLLESAPNGLYYFNVPFSFYHHPETNSLQFDSLEFWYHNYTGTRATSWY